MAVSEALPGLDSHSLTRERQSLGAWIKSGDPWIWMTATAVGLSLVAVVGLIGLIAAKGLAHFWPSEIHNIVYQDRSGEERIILGEISDYEHISRTQYLEATMSHEAGLPSEIERVLYKTGNRRIDSPDFRWVYSHKITSRDSPEDVVVVERTEWGNAIGYLRRLTRDGTLIDGEDVWLRFQALIQSAAILKDDRQKLQSGAINRINYDLERLRLEGRRRELNGFSGVHADLEERRVALEREYAIVEAELRAISTELARNEAHFTTATGKQLTIPLEEVVQAWMPNRMSTLQKIGLYFNNLWNFLTDAPREANTEGGIYPALFGTVLMVLLMTVFVTPFGVVAALYLREYAKQGPIVQLVRIAVNNLAGVPSIVYGVFGLGFFVYLIGGSIDTLFFPEAKPAPTFGTPGLIWASLTLALLTVPVVIVSTEEGLTRIPRELREGSLALGATKAETIFRIVLPMASPSILTGIILAIARAAGEVAPLMLVGVVKLAPTLPVDGNFPFLHLERKFMHLGFHIYDVGFQSPNVDAARPLVFATALLLVVIIIFLNLTAITLRNRLERKFKLNA